MTSISKNVFLDKLDDTVNKYNNIYHRTIKMKSDDVKSSIYIVSNNEDINESPKFKVGDDVRILKCKNIFGNGYAPNCSEQVFLIKKIKTLCRGHMLLAILTEKKLLERFMKKNYKNKSKRVQSWKSNKERRQ